MSYTEWVLLAFLVAAWAGLVIVMICYCRLVTRYGELAHEYARLSEWLGKP